MLQLRRILIPCVLLALQGYAQLGLYTNVDSWPPGPGQPTATQEPDLELTEMLQQVDPVRVQAIIEKLVSFGTRNTLSNQTDPLRGIGAARDWIFSEMQTIAAASNGRMTVEIQSYLQQPTSTIPNATIISNVIATLRGSTEPNRAYVVSGHYDSRVTNVTNHIDDSPGADDDGSGVAVSMELARVMATHPSAATIMFAAVSGEEQGLYGSDNMAKILKAAGVDVQGMLDNDIVGSPTGDDGATAPFDLRMFVEGIPSPESSTETAYLSALGGENDSPARELGRFVTDVSQNSLTQMSVRPIYRTDRFLRGGDHMPFLEQGFPAVRFTEPYENFAHQHQDVRIQDGMQYGDLVEFCDFEYIARVARVNGAAIWSLAQAPGTPKNVSIDTSVLTNNSTLSWAYDPRADGGYEILWRATDEPFWSHVIPVGNVSRATVLLSKDNVDFGVRAVGQNGYRSPAASPFSYNL